MKPVPWRWAMIGFAFAATLINYLDRQALSVAAPTLFNQFHLTNTAYSNIVLAFMLAYTIMNGLSGPIIDRVGTKVGYALCIGWWSVAAMLHALARGVTSFGICRFLLGMGEAGNWPAGVRVVAEWFPERERALASGIFNSGSALGAILAPPLVGWIIIAFGWRTSFVAVGVAGLLWLGLWLALYRKPPHEVAAAAGAAPVRSGWTPGKLLQTRFVVVFTISKIFMDPVWYFYTFWFPLYLSKARGYDTVALAKWAWIPFAVAGFGNLLGGLLSGGLLRMGWSTTAARKGAVTVFAVLMMSAIPAVLARDNALAIGLVSVAMLGYTGCLANMLAMPADVFPRDAVATVFGFASMGSGFGGMVFAWLTGRIVDHFSYVPVFVGFGLLPLICAGLLWLFLGPLSPVAIARHSASSAPRATG